ncbi:MULTISPECIES: DUF488 domain-containing protein [unclassified Methanoregula]|uniref:DUF488 domain-containing protein n=1 Tax=unclassified Methanoregula TaxID=2649730 RepID=UPI0009C7D7D8|nr:MULTISPECIES: DUF488 domain-containing protein [unclassified Methanoregula]OPX64566.1 MAG: hypothetical protein A4E33_00813 [Methanoregula sp. PtaB.Bin085]OPY33319.1 MAG: hypothetical protein A4E34_02024 [Methanoregula sp. PtaU1.Bin006]
MLFTSSFTKSAKHPGAVSIARFPPDWYTGRCYFPLAPKPAMLQIGDWAGYRRRYREEILAPLDPDAVLRELGVEGADHDVVLLCFEKNRSHCHRGLVAEWLEKKTGIRVPELDNGPGIQSTLWDQDCR